MSNKWKKISFVVVDVIVLGFFGFYLALNYKYSNSEENPNSDFTTKSLLANESACTGSNQYKKSDGTCGTCGTDSTPNSDHTKCICNSISVTLDGCGGEYSSSGVDENGNPYSGTCEATFTVTPNTATISEASWSVTSGGDYGSVDKDTGKFTADSSKIKGLDCDKTVTIQYKVKNACGNEASATKTIAVTAGWGGPTNKTVYSDSYINYTRPQAEKDSKSVAYERCNPDKAPAVCQKFTRGCGQALPEPACYKDDNGFLWWDNNPSNSQYQSYNSSTGRYDEKKGYTRTTLTKEQCYVQFSCATSRPGEQTKNTECNATDEFTGDYLKKCGVKEDTTIGDQIYKIECTETMKTAFNGPIFNNSDYPNSFMYPGTAFKFNFEAKTKVECKGTWNKDYYNAAKSYAAKHLKDNYESTYYDDALIKDASKGLAKIYDSYTNWTLDYFTTTLSSESGIIKDEQPKIANMGKDEHEFNLELEDGYQKEVSYCPKEGLVTHDNNGNKNFTYSVSYNLKMQMPVVYYSSSLIPQYTTTPTNGYTALGRVFPISEIKEMANNNNYKYYVEISHLGMGHKWTNTESCNIAVKNKEIVFRSINLSDPFIEQLSQSNHEIGRNWLNEKFDFTGIIDKNTWNNTPQFNKITINTTVGKLIKNEIAKQYEIGICESSRSNLAPQICTLYRQAINGK